MLDEFLNETLFSSLTTLDQPKLAQRLQRSSTAFRLGWLTAAEFAPTINPRHDAVLRGRNGSAPQPAATVPNAATRNGHPKAIHSADSGLVARFRGSNHIKRPRRACMTRNDGMAIDVFDTGHNAFLELMF
ncbi:hypothetical protein LPU83_pLPU83d_1137 (plasmid) [Rhizobium favelukesii]|uniref:Uncharacterized protein n=1 Tax=Rhizobium favelukesii TaxID=348824 RepID=W6RN51_9HYPH|nr:hypothetical protein LPU83_pLPU83d_1137 [Rhizobium favelukesii]